MALIICLECGKEFSDKASACPNCGCPTQFITQSPVNKNQTPIKEFQTGLGKIIAYDSFVKLVPGNLFSLGRPERFIYYSNIGGISYRPTSLVTQGYIQFIVNGSVAKEVNIFKKNWEKELAKDENTIMIKYTRNKDFKKECDDFVDFLRNMIN